MSRHEIIHSRNKNTVLFVNRGFLEKGSHSFNCFVITIYDKIAKFTTLQQ